MMYTACTAEPCPAARRSHAAHSVQYDPCKKRPRGQSVWSTPHRRLIRNQLRQNGARHVCRGIVFHGASLPAAQLYIIIYSLHCETPSCSLTPGRSPAEDQAAEKKCDIHVALFSYPAAGRRERRAAAPSAENLLPGEWKCVRFLPNFPARKPARTRTGAGNGPSGRFSGAHFRRRDEV